MAKVSIILDRRITDNQGRHPMKLRVTSKNTNTTVSTNVCVSPAHFAGNPECAVLRNCPGARQINMAVHELYCIYTSTIIELERSGRINSMTAADIRDYVENKKDYVTERTFTSCFIEYRDSCRTFKTQQTYDYTLQLLGRFKQRRDFRFEDIDFKFLTDFDRWMEDNNIGTSSRSIVLRNMRTVYNYAINNDWVSMQSYPFRKFKIKQGHKEKVYLPEEKMRELLTIDLSQDSEWQGMTLARDFFLLSFFFCGINPIDLFNLSYQSDTISFVRQKIKFHDPQPIHISIQPEAQYLIGEHKGDTHLLNLAEKYYSFESCYHYMKHRLKKLGGLIGCPGLSFYWARYSWATYASKIDVSDSTISKALGHADSTLAEKKYISFDWAKVDKANRRVIDYVLYGKRQ